MMVTVVRVATGDVVTVNVVVTAPAGTVTLVGTAAAGWLLASVTTAPPGGALVLRVTVPLEVPPPFSNWGLSRNEESATLGCTFSVAERLLPAKVAVMPTAVPTVTPLVLTVKLAEAAPRGTVTLAGTVAAAGLLLVSVITAPPAGAGFVSVTVPVDEAPPATEVGLTVRAARPGPLLYTCTSTSMLSP